MVDGVRKRWMDLLYFNNGRERTCGVAILIKRDSVQNIREVHTGEGRLLSVTFFKMFMHLIMRLTEPCFFSHLSNIVWVTLTLV